MRKLILIALAFVLVRCNDSHQEPATQSTNDSTSASTSKDERPVSDPDETITGCYQRVLGRDSFLARLQQSGDQVTGKLAFNNYEKDRSSGEVKGRLDSGIIKLLYTFQSEGMTSVMEVYFKKTAQGLVRGIGDMQNHGDTALFSNPNSVRFPADETWRSLPCN